MEWQPLETAPINETVLIALDGRYVTTGDKTRVFGWGWNPTDEESEDSRPTHWMPLPNPPEAKE